MNVFIFSKPSHHGRWLLVATLSIAAAGCNEPTTQKNAPAQAKEQTGDGVILANNDGSMPEIQGLDATVTNALSIRLPPDRSTLSPGPDILLADGGTACLACHNGTVEETLQDPLTRVAFEVTKEGCLECHSADYVSSQPKLVSAAWQKVVTKMVDKFDPPSIANYLNPAHQGAMVQYLTVVYGP
ncbi:MAG: hypothetical protein HY273_04550 [Gammaproteobacteria bacterium]|nr:hypothetical protein [Gammaproteobacteria bacterium]